MSFDTADKNKDGRVNREEASDIPGFNFSSADTNDGRVVEPPGVPDRDGGLQPRG